MKHVLTLRAEEASTALRTSLGHHKLQARCVEGRRRRNARIRLAPTGAGASQLLRQTTLVHMVSILESFVRDTLLARGDAELDPTHVMQAALWKRARSEADAGWLRQERAFDDWLSIPMAKEPSYQPIKAYVAARNAVVHGLGELTPRLLGGDGGVTTGRLLHTVGIRLTEGRLILPAGVAANLAGSGTTFVTWVDGRAWPAPPP